MSKSYLIIFGFTVLIMSVIIIHMEPESGIIFTFLGWSAAWLIVAQLFAPARKRVSNHLDKIEAKHKAKPL